jgi:hypothetical protein
MENRLKSLLSIPASITITDNTRSILSFRRKDHAFHVRLHHIFLKADEKILRAVAEYISGNSRRPLEMIRNFIRENSDAIRRNRRPSPGNINIKHQGTHFNLLDSFHMVNESYFNGEIICSISWGKIIKRSCRRSIRLGSYSPVSDMIRINPVLDRDYVPQYVVDSIIYHEMLHKFLGFRNISGRRFFHDSVFKEMEKNFVHGSAAKAWIKNNLNLLMRKV